MSLTDPDDFAAVVAAARCPRTNGGAAPDAEPAAAAGAPTAMAEALLREIADHMRAVGEGEERRTVTLRGLPIGPADYAAVRAALGEGEVSARVSVLGLTEIAETALSGVWWITERDAAGTVTAEHVEIAPAPLILAAHRDDIAAAAARLAARLGDGASHAMAVSGEMEDGADGRTG